MNSVCKSYGYLRIDDSQKEHEFYMQLFKHFLDNIQNVLDDILNMVNNPNLREESLALIAYVIAIHFKQNFDSTKNTLLGLPKTVSMWPETKSKVFFLICSLQLETQG